MTTSVNGLAPEQKLALQAVSHEIQCWHKQDSNHRPVHKVAWHQAMATKLHDYDVAKHLCSREEMAAYLEAAIVESDGDAAFITMALGDIARAKGMAELSRETGLGRESLYKALSAEGNPQLSTVLKVAKALGLRLHVKSAA